MREQYMRGGEGFLMIYSVIERRSFNEIARLREAVNRVKNSEHVPIVLVGNKCDLESRREVSKEEGIQMAKRFSCPFFETSAAHRLNVDESFHEIVRCIQRQEKADHNAATIRGNGDRRTSKGSNSSFCCAGSPTDD
jgi:small GTP-binding protein